MHIHVSKADLFHAPTVNRFDQLKAMNTQTKKFSDSQIKTKKTKTKKNKQKKQKNSQKNKTKPKFHQGHCTILD